MAKPKKICDKCGHQMSGHHYWYKGAWKCKGGGKDKAVPAKDGDKKDTEKKPVEAKDGSKKVMVDGKYEVTLSKKDQEFVRDLEAMKKKGIKPMPFKNTRDEGKKKVEKK